MIIIIINYNNLCVHRMIKQFINTNIIYKCINITEKKKTMQLCRTSRVAVHISTEPSNIYHKPLYWSRTISSSNSREGHLDNLWLGCPSSEKEKKWSEDLSEYSRSELIHIWTHVAWSSWFRWKGCRVEKSSAVASNTAFRSSSFPVWDRHIRIQLRWRINNWGKSMAFDSPGQR